MVCQNCQSTDIVKIQGQFYCINCGQLVVERPAVPKVSAPTASPKAASPVKPATTEAPKPSKPTQPVIAAKAPQPSRPTAAKAPAGSQMVAVSTAPQTPPASPPAPRTVAGGSSTGGANQSANQGPSQSSNQIVNHRKSPPLSAAAAVGRPGTIDLRPKPPAPAAEPIVPAATAPVKRRFGRGLRPAAKAAIPPAAVAPSTPVVAPKPAVSNAGQVNRPAGPRPAPTPVAPVRSARPAQLVQPARPANSSAAPNTPAAPAITRPQPPRSLEEITAQSWHGLVDRRLNRPALLAASLTALLALAAGYPALSGYRDFWTTASLATDGVVGAALRGGDGYTASIIVLASLAATKAVIFFIALWASANIIFSTSRLEDGRPAEAAQRRRASLNSLLPLTGLTILTGCLGLLLLAATAAIGWYIHNWQLSWQLAILGASSLVIAYLGLGLAISHTLASVAIVLRQISVFRAIGQGWRAYTGHFSQVANQALVYVLISLPIGLVTGFAGLMTLRLASNLSSNLATGLASGLGLASLAFLSTWLLIGFSAGFWARSYRQLLQTTAHNPQHLSGRQPHRTSPASILAVIIIIIAIGGGTAAAGLSLRPMITEQANHWLPDSRTLPD